MLALVRSAAALDGICDSVEGDLADLPDFSDVLDGMDAIIHCASPRTLERQEALQSDIEPTGRLLESWSTGTFVFTSSQTVYGIPHDDLDERRPVQPDNWYDLAKVVNERQVAMAVDVLGGVGVSLRLPLVYGSGPKRRNGQYLPLLYDALRAGRSFLFDNERAIEECGSVFVGERDLGRAVAASIGVKKSGSYNVCTGFVTWRQLIDSLASATGLNAHYVVREGAIPRPDEFRVPQSRSFYDCSAFKQVSGFSPKDQLEEIIASFVKAERRSATGLVS